MPQHWSLGTLGPVMVGGEMCGGLRLLAHNLGLGTGSSGSLAPALAPPQLILTAGTLPGPCFCCYKCSPISLQRRPGRQLAARRCGEELVSSVRSCVIPHHNSPPPARAWPGSSYTASCLTSTSPGGPYTTVVTTLTGMGVKYCVETESFYIDIQVWVQL